MHTTFSFYNELTPRRRCVVPRFVEHEGKLGKLSSLIDRDDEVTARSESKIRAPLFAARTLNVKGQSRVTLSLQ